MEHYYKNVRGAFTFPALYFEMVTRFDNAEFVEIGCDCGQSACFIGVEIINRNKNIKLNLSIFSMRSFSAFSLIDGAGL